MTAVFITATGTDIGKTFIARGMIAELRARGRSVDALKPVITGFDPREPQTSDTGRLLLALGATLTSEGIAAASPYRLREPLSPDMAARRDGTAIDFATLVAHGRNAVAAHRNDALIIEGIGGIMVPLNDRHTVLDWMIALDVPLILATGSYVGTLSHTLTALDVLDRAGLEVAAVVVNETPGSAASLEETAAAIRPFAAGIEVLMLPRLPEGKFEHATMAALADLM
jgi:dethiobiotin synthetase